MAIKNISIYSSKIILSEMNNNLIINSNLGTTTNVTVIWKVFRYFIYKISLTSNFKSMSNVHKVLNEIDLITSKDEYILLINIMNYLIQLHLVVTKIYNFILIENYIIFTEPFHIVQNILFNNL